MEMEIASVIGVMIVSGIAVVFVLYAGRRYTSLGFRIPRLGISSRNELTIGDVKRSAEAAIDEATEIR